MNLETNHPRLKILLIILTIILIGVIVFAIVSIMREKAGPAVNNTPVVVPDQEKVKIETETKELNKIRDAKSGAEASTNSVTDIKNLNKNVKVNPSGTKSIDEQTKELNALRVK
jgi:hypothetical protein